MTDGCGLEGTEFLLVKRLSSVTHLYCADCMLCAKPGPEEAFVDEEGTPIFMPHVEEWMKAMRTKLLQWSSRLLVQARHCPAWDFWVYITGFGASTPMGCMSHCLLVGPVRCRSGQSGTLVSLGKSLQSEDSEWKP
jgi:hypothetical protein